MMVMMRSSWKFIELKVPVCILPMLTSDQWKFSYELKPNSISLCKENQEIWIWDAINSHLVILSIGISKVVESLYEVHCFKN